MRVFPSLLLLPPSLLACAAALKLGSSAKEDDDEPVLAHEVLRAAVVEQGLSKDDAEKVTEQCVPNSLGEVWRRSLKTAVEEVLVGTKRSVQRGLLGIATSFMDLRAGATCGNLAALNRLHEQAEGLKVLASYRSLGALDSKVKYEPLKSLTVGDIDVHTELNALIETWQLKKGASEVGTALGQLLGKFASDAGEEAPVLADGAATSAKHKKRSAYYWVDAFNAAYKHLGDPSSPVVKGCLSGVVATRLSKLLDQSFETMMQQSRRAMQAGLKQVSTDLEAILGELEGTCDKLGASAAAKHLRDAAKRLAVLSGVKNLVNPGVHVEYDPKKVLKVAGVDVHLELNRFIGAWINDDDDSAKLGIGLADFFEDFKEQQEVDDQDAGATDEPLHPIFQMIKSGLQAAMASSSEELKLGANCFKEDATSAFGDEVEAAIEHMLQKRKMKMQRGLKELADAVARLFAAQPAECVQSSGAKAIWDGAKKLKRITRRTVVDYGTHIKYEAMKSLSIGGTDVHVEINDFLRAWKLHSKAEAGPGFGQLMRRMSTVTGYDEL